MVRVNWEVLFTFSAGVLLESDKESVGLNMILYTECEEFKRLALFPNQRVLNLCNNNNQCFTSISLFFCLFVYSIIQKFFGDIIKIFFF